MSNMRDSTFIVVKNHEEKSRRTFYMPKIYNKSSLLNLKKRLVSRKVSKFSSSYKTLTAETMPSSPQPSISPLKSPPSRNLNLNKVKSIEEKRIYLSSVSSKSPQQLNPKSTPLQSEGKIVIQYGDDAMKVGVRKRNRRIRSMAE
jgi:hypothetical protein